MEVSGLHSHQVVEVRGYADSKLRDPQHPTNYRNRRVSILVNTVNVPGSSPGDEARQQLENQKLPMGAEMAQTGKLPMGAEIKSTEVPHAEGHL